MTLNNENYNIKEELKKLENLIIQFNSNLNSKYDSLNSKYDSLNLNLNLNSMGYTLLNRMSHLEKSIKTVNNNINNRSTIQENEMTYLLLSLLKQKNKTEQEYINIYDLKYIYKQNGTQLTDLDGIIIFDNNKLFQERKENINSRNTTNNIKKGLTDNLEKKENVIYILESKNHFIKNDIDKKMQQIIEFKNIIKDFNNYKNTTDEFKNMLNRTNNFNQFSDNIYLYFCTDHITNITMEYIRLIFNDFNEEDYKKFILKLFKDDNNWINLVKDLRKKNFQNNIPNLFFEEITRDYYDNKRKKNNKNIENYDKNDELELKKNNENIENYDKNKELELKKNIDCYFKKLESLEDIRAFLKLINENINKVKTKLIEKKNIKKYNENGIEHYDKFFKENEKHKDLILKINLYLNWSLEYKEVENLYKHFNKKIGLIYLRKDIDLTKKIEDIMLDNANISH